MYETKDNYIKPRKKWIIEKEKKKSEIIDFERGKSGRRKEGILLNRG